MKCDLSFDFLEKYQIVVSDVTKNLLARMLAKDPAKRLSASQCLQHPALNFDSNILRNSKTEMSKGIYDSNTFSTLEIENTVRNIHTQKTTLPNRLEDLLHMNKLS